MKYKNYSNGDQFYGKIKNNHMNGLGVILRPNQ